MLVGFILCLLQYLVGMHLSLFFLSKNMTPVTLRATDFQV